ncbi:MAG: thiol-disulfide isomerase/thioredoxin [Polaribacter sp.]|jgi:thiol-disulfide isomerase/thioredoxin
MNNHEIKESEIRNQETKPVKKKKSTLLDWVIQALVLASVFFAVTWWQKKDMLSTEQDNLAPSFSLISMQDQLIQFDPTQQSKKTLLYFFATWCGVCHASIDNIEAIKGSVGDSVNFYAIALDWKTKEEVKGFLAQHDLTIPILLGNQEVWQNYQIGGFPSYYVIDENGKLASKDMGYTTELGMRFRLGF